MQKYILRLDNSVLDVVRLKPGTFAKQIKGEKDFIASEITPLGIMFCHKNPQEKNSTLRKAYVFIDHHRNLFDFMELSRNYELNPSLFFDCIQNEPGFHQCFFEVFLDSLTLVMTNSIKESKIVNGMFVVPKKNLVDYKKIINKKTISKDEYKSMGIVKGTFPLEDYPISVTFPGRNSERFNAEDLVFYWNGEE